MIREGWLFLNTRFYLTLTKKGQVFNFLIFGENGGRFYIFHSPSLGPLFALEVCY